MTGSLGDAPTLVRSRSRRLEVDVDTLAAAKFADRQKEPDPDYQQCADDDEDPRGARSRSIWHDRFLEQTKWGAKINPPPILSVDDLNDLAGLRLDKDGLAVDHGVAVLAASPWERSY